MWPESRVWFDGEWVVYEGTISDESNGAALALFNQHPGAGLKIDSPGGSIEAGLNLGQWVLTRGLTVYVEGACYSSCANYVFTAGRTRIVDAGAIIGWHGGTRQWSDEADMCTRIGEEDGLDSPRYGNCLETAAVLRDREIRFFEIAGVDPAIAVLGLGDGANYPSRPTDTAWTYSLADLERLGVDRVTVVGGDWRPRTPVDGTTVCRFDLDAGRCEPMP